MYIVSVGNVADGMAFYGPFEDSDEAISWGNEIAGADDWCAITLLEP